MDVIAALVREFGWQITLLILVIGGLALSVRVLATRYEKLYEKRLEDINTGHTNEVKALKEGHQNEILALKLHSEKGWEMASAFREQAERLANRYVDSTELARDMADELLDRRKVRRPTPRAGG